LHLAEFSYNNYQASIKTAPFEEPYGRKCRSTLCWDEVGERRILGSEVIIQAAEKVRIIRTSSNSTKQTEELGRHSQKVVGI